MTLYQIVTPILALVAVLYVWNLVKTKKKTTWEALLWTILWVCIATIAVVPGILQYLTALTGIKDQVNAIVFTAIGILFMIMFYLITKLEELQQQHVRLVRTISLLEIRESMNKVKNEK